MISKLAVALTTPGSGLIFQAALSEIILLLLLAYIAKVIVFPVVSSYKHAKKLDQVAKLSTKERHWFYGHLSALGKSTQERLNNLMKLTRSFPTMVNFWRGPVMSTTMFFHSDLAQSFFASGAPKDELTYGYLRPWIGDGLLTSKGEKWKRNRQLLTPAFHFNVLKPYVAISNDTSKIMIEKWKKKIGQPLNISEDVSMMTLDTMIQCAMSTKTDCQLSDGQHPYIESIKEITSSVVSRIRTPVYYVEWIFKLSRLGRKFYKHVDMVHKHAEEIIAKRRNALKEEKSNKRIQNGSASNAKNVFDFLDILLQTRDGEGKGLSDKEIRDEVDTFLFEGHDTTSSGIQWSLYNLAKYPQLQEKCRKEILAVAGTKDDIAWEDLGKLPYLTMFIKENLRLYPPVPSVSRKLDKPMNIKCKLNNPEENIIPAKSATAIHIYAMHRNEHVWENPNKFLPERFTKENSSARHSHSYVPFAAGPRNCIGQNFAMNEMKVALAQTLRSFRLYLDEETPEPEMEMRLILQSKDGIFIKLDAL